MPPSTSKAGAPGDWGDDKSGRVSSDGGGTASLGFAHSAKAPRRFEILTLALLVLTLFFITILVLLVVVDKQITSRSAAESERALRLAQAIRSFNGDMKIIDISERAYTLYGNTEAVFQYKNVVDHLGAHLYALADIAKETPREEQALSVVADLLAQHLQTSVRQMLAPHEERNAANLRFEQAIGGANITQITTLANVLGDDVHVRRAALIAQTTRFGHYSAIALVTLLICTSISFAALTYSVKLWLQHREATVIQLHDAKLEADKAGGAKTNFLALMSHELRTPLNAILGFAEIIRDRLFGVEKEEFYSNYAAHIHDSGAHLLKLIDKILDVVQNNEGKTILHLEDVDVCQVAASCLNMVASQAEKAGIVLTSRVPPRLPSLRADPLRLTEIILNLLSNAIKFTPPGGRVCLTLEVRFDELVIRIDDSGIGIPPQKMRVLFEPFGYIADPLSGNQRGSGLGLPIAKHLVELHGGRLAITSHIGTGTIAEIMLPFWAASDRPGGSA